MNASIYRFTLDIHSAQSQISLPVMLNDTSRRLYISLSEGGKLYHIADGCMAVVRINRPTRTYIEQFCAIEDNINIVYDFSQYTNTAIVEGLHECEVTLYGLDGGVLTTARFSMVVSARVVNKESAVITDENWTMLDSIAAEEAKRQAGFAAAIFELENRKPRVALVSILASEWEGNDNHYSQVVAIDGVTEWTRVDLTPTAHQLAIFHEKDITFVTENVAGVVTVHAIGEKPMNDYVIPATLLEVMA